MGWRLRSLFVYVYVYCEMFDIINVLYPGPRETSDHKVSSLWRSRAPRATFRLREPRSKHDLLADKRAAASSSGGKTPEWEI